MGKKPASNTSKPLSGAERAEVFNFGLGSINQAMGGQGYTPAGAPTKRWVSGSPFGVAGEDGSPGGYYETVPGAPGSGPPTFSAPSYTAPTFTGMGDAKTLSEGDYGRLEESIINSRWAPLQRYESQVRNMTDEDLSRRGIYSSGVATQAQGDVTEQFAPQYAAAGAEAATQRYGLQAQEQQMLNQLAIQEAARRTGFDTSQAAAEYASKWAPLEYLMQLYGQTGGTTSTSTPGSAGWGGALGTALGAGAGFMLGGPAGMAAGGSIGGSIGGSF